MSLFAFPDVSLPLLSFPKFRWYYNNFFEPFKLEQESGGLAHERKSLTAYWGSFVFYFWH